jgi:hypothetical protein
LCRPRLPGRSISARAWTPTGQGLPGPRPPGGAPAADFAAGHRAEATCGDLRHLRQTLLHC